MAEALGEKTIDIVKSTVPALEKGDTAVTDRMYQYQTAYLMTGLAQIRVVSEAMRSGAFMSLFQACWQASRIAS